MRCVAILAAALVALAIAPAAPAVAASVADVVAALETDPVHVDPAADPGLTPAEAERLRGAIATAGAGPIHVAVLSEETLNEAGGSVDTLLRRLMDGVGREGTYVVVAAGRFRARSTGTPPSTVVAAAADQAFASKRGEGVAAVVTDLVRRLALHAAGRTTGLPGGPLDAPASGTRQAATGDGQTTIGMGALALPLLLVGGAVLLVRSVRRRAAQAATTFDDGEGLVEPPRPAAADVRALAEQDVLDLGGDIYALDPEVHAPEAEPRAGAAFREAVLAYDRAGELVADARTEDDLAAVTEAIEQGRYAIAATRALLNGEEPPPRRPPCFFDPRHGPSVRDVPWAPPGGAPRPVPACATDAARVEAGVEPATRELDVDGARMPYWQAPPRYGSWAGGWFGGYGGSGLLTGLLLGSLGTVVVGGLLDPAAAADDTGWGDEADGAGGGDLGGDIGGGDLGGEVGGGDL